MEGFVFIQAQIGCAEEAAGRVAALDGILGVEVVTGPYDIVARARRDCEYALVRCLEEEIEAVPGITRVLVCPLASHARVWEMGVLEPDEEEAFAELIQAFRAELKGFDRNAEDSAHFVDEFFGRTSSPATGAT